MDRAPTAALWLPDDRAAEWAHLWPQLVATQEWELLRTLAPTWPELLRLLGNGQVDIGLIPTWDSLPELPRIVALEDLEGPLIPPSGRPRWRR